jgi:hypothetical protein
VTQVYTLQREQLVPLSPVETFGFFADAFNLEAITPPWLGFRVATPRPIAMGVGALARAVLVRRDLDRVFDYRRDAVAARLGNS